MGLQEIKSLAFAFFWIDLLFLPAFQSVKLPFQGSLHHTKQYPDSWARNAKKSWIFQKIRLRNILRQECQASKYKELYLACIFQNNFYKLDFRGMRQKSICFLKTWNATSFPHDQSRCLRQKKRNSSKYQRSHSFFTVCQVWWMAWHPLGQLQYLLLPPQN